MSGDLIDIFLQNCPHDSEYYFRECRISDNILSKFHREDWQKIVSWIGTEKELFDYIRELPYCMAALVYASRKTDEPLNFILILRDHSSDENTVSFHGGSWSSPFITFRTGRQLLYTLSRCSFKVRTSIKTENLTAQRFVEAIGMAKSTCKNNIFWYKNSDKLIHKINILKK